MWADGPIWISGTSPVRIGVGIAVIQVAVGFGVFVKNQLSRWIGVVFLAANAIAQLLMMPAYPFWSLTIFAIDILAIYGLVAYGHKIAPSR
jgi:hypothetical protein